MNNTHIREWAPRLRRAGKHSRSFECANPLRLRLLSSSRASPAHRRKAIPDRPIKLVVPYPAGGPTDTIARTVSQSLSGALGQSIVIENQSGAGGRIA